MSIVDVWIQLGLAGFGIAALVMAMGHSLRARKWAPVVGLMGQPLWLAFALQAQAWGVLALVAAYTAAFTWGAWLHWRPRRRRKA